MKSHLILCVMISGVFALVGCQTNHSVVRGQSPGYGPMGQNPSPMYYDGPSADGTGTGAWNCPPCHNHPYGAECPLCAPDHFWTPTHHHTYDYRQPKNLVYPPHNQPAATVVYPYYTLKGPSDFFMK
jgi:hypothetical protein